MFPCFRELQRYSADSNTIDDTSLFPIARTRRPARTWSEVGRFDATGSFVTDDEYRPLLSTLFTLLVDFSALSRLFQP